MDKKTELEAQAYRTYVQLEKHQIEIVRLQQEIQKIVAEIQKLNELPDKDAA